MSACDSFLDINTDPDAATAVPGGLLFSTALASWGSNRSMEGGQYTNYFSQTYSSNAILANWWHAERYAISATAVNNHWLAYYGTLQRNSTLGIESALSASPARVNEAAQFEIIRALNYYESTLLWERVPLTQANQPAEFPTPVFDDQPTVLNGILAKLDAAIAMIDVANPLLGLGARDVVYGASLNGTLPAQQMQNWIRLANSGKLHVLMTLRSGGQNVDAQIQALIDNPNLIRVSTQNAYIPFNALSKNPLGRMQEVYAGSPNWFWSGGPITNIMNATDDPRRPVYMDEVPSAPGTFANAPAGLGLGANNASRTRRNTYLSVSAPVALMYAHEVLFLEAEFLASTGSLGAADAKFRAGIDQAFAMLPQRTGGGASAPAATARDAFKAQFPNLATLSQQDALRHIWHQHYVGLHGDGIQSWTLVRRVGEPVFGMTLHPSSTLTSWISRWPYQVNEVAANPNAPQENPPLEQNMWFQNSAQQ